MNNVRTVPGYLAVYEWGEPAFQALHISAGWFSGAESEPFAGGVGEQAGMPIVHLIPIRAGAKPASP